MILILAIMLNFIVCAYYEYPFEIAMLLQIATILLHINYLISVYIIQERKKEKLLEDGSFYETQRLMKDAFEGGRRQDYGKIVNKRKPLDTL